MILKLLSTYFPLWEGNIFFKEVYILPLSTNSYTTFFRIEYLYTDGKGNPHLSVPMRVGEKGTINQF